MNLNAANFVEENLKTIFAYSLSRVSNKDDAEDLCNDIVLAILNSADKLKDEKAFYGYVWGIAANTYRKFMRKRMRSQFEEIDESIADTTDFTEEISLKDDIMNLRREIALLSKEYRECTIAYYFDEISCKEVADKLDISLEMVKYYLFKTRKILKEGISMEREFGEKSFRPAPFEFITVFGEMYNEEYRNLFARKLPGQSCKIMRNHAPRCIQDQIEHNVFQTCYFYTIGLIGGCAVKSKALELPEFDGPAAMYVREK